MLNGDIFLLDDDAGFLHRLGWLLEAKYQIQDEQKYHFGGLSFV